MKEKGYGGIVLNVDHIDYLESDESFERVREIANNRLTQIINEADAEIKAHQIAIKKSEQAIENKYIIVRRGKKKYGCLYGISFVWCRK